MLNVAIRAARAAGAIINRAALDVEAVRISQKQVNDFVTEVDHASENAIIETLLAAYPSHGIHAEESGTAHGNPRRLTVGLDAQRLAMLLAVVHRHAGIACFDQDVFVNAVGGVKIGEPAADLSVLLAIVSSLKNKALPEKLVVFGEVGLAGEIRPAPRGQERLKEAAKLGFTRALIPHANAPRQPIAGMQVIAVQRVDEAVQRLRELD